MPHILSGVVIRTGRIPKTCSVAVNEHFQHPKYLKTVRKTTKYLVHDEYEVARVDDKVTIIHGRAFSARKHFRLGTIDRRGEGLTPETDTVQEGYASRAAAGLVGKLRRLRLGDSAGPGEKGKGRQGQVVAKNVEGGVPMGELLGEEEVSGGEDASPVRRGDGERGFRREKRSDVSSAQQTSSTEGTSLPEATSSDDSESGIRRTQSTSPRNPRRSRVMDAIKQSRDTPAHLDKEV